VPAVVAVAAADVNWFHRRERAAARAGLVGRA
jgi:hypothetical protein